MKNCSPGCVASYCEISNRRGATFTLRNVISDANGRLPKTVCVARAADSSIQATRRRPLRPTGRRRFSFIMHWNRWRAMNAE